MGFWHTGYIEFHDYSGLDRDWQPLPTVYRCDDCLREFNSAEALQRHRFESHPSIRPRLAIAGMQLGQSTVHIASRLAAADICMDAAEEAEYNGRSIAVQDVPNAIARITNDRIRLVLVNGAVRAEFDIDIRAATARDIDGVEAAFDRLAEGHELTARAIDAFNRETVGYRSAAPYAGGIAAYLYGVAAKEQTRGISIPEREYPERFDRAATLLTPYNRPLSRLVRGLVSFHFNHFADAAAVSPPACIALAAKRFQEVLNGGSWQPATVSSENRVVGVLADAETSDILRWADLPAATLAEATDELEARVQGDCSSYARLKLLILLLSASEAAGDAARAVKAARQLRSYGDA